MELAYIKELKFKACVWGQGLLFHAWPLQMTLMAKKYKIHFNPGSTDLYKGYPNFFHWYWDLSLLNDLLHAEHYLHIF